MLFLNKAIRKLVFYMINTQLFGNIVEEALEEMKLMKIILE